MSNDNLKLWESVEKTDPAYTKKVNQRGGFTSISPQYQAKIATQQWGSYGSTWGLKNINHDYSLFEVTRMAVLHAVFFYPGGEFEITNATEVVSAKGYPDTDFAKKLETNTISKALARLGFSADVFMGQFDDIDYVNQVNNEKALEKAINQDEIADKQRAEYNTEMKSYADAMETALSIHELSAIYKKAMRVAGYKNDEKVQLRLTQIKDERLTAIKEKAA